MTTNYSDIEVTRGAKTLMRKVLRAYESVQPLMDSAIEQNAREVMKSLPIVTEYLQAMGSWHFEVNLTAANGKPYYKGELLLGAGNEDQIQSILDHHDECGETEPEDIVSAEHYDQLVTLLDLLAGHASMMDEFTDMFGNGLNPMRFSADGPKITDW